MKESTKIFIRTVKLTSVWLVCFIIIIFGICESYTQLRRIGFGEYKNAVEYNNGVFRILDFLIDTKRLF